MVLPKHLSVGRSNIHGVGLFTKKAFRKGDICFVGARQTKYIEDPTVPIGHIGQHAIIPEIHCPQVGKDTFHVYSFDSFMNHADDPNTKVVYLDELSYHHIALKDLVEGEELTVSYDDVYSTEYPDEIIQKGISSPL
jgi:SET domain-containing protein